MLEIKIEGVKEFERQLQKMALNTSKTMPVFLHQQAQMFVGALARELKKNAPTISKIDSDVFGSLDNGGGIRVNRRNWKKAQKLMGDYQEKADAQIKRLEAQYRKKRINFRRMAMLEKAKRNRNMIAVKMSGHHGNLSFYQATREFQKRDLSRLSQEIQYLHRAKATRIRLNLPALAARFEINRRHSGAGGMAGEMWDFWKKLRACPLGSAFSIDEKSRDKWSWENRAKLVKAENIVSLAMTSPGWRQNKVKNQQILSDALRIRTDDMKNHLEKKLQPVFK